MMDITRVSLIALNAHLNASFALTPHFALNVRLDTILMGYNALNANQTVLNAPHRLIVQPVLRHMFYKQTSATSLRSTA